MFGKCSDGCELGSVDCGIKEGVSERGGYKGGPICIYLYSLLPIPSLSSEAIYVYQLVGCSGALGWLLNKPIWHVNGIHAFGLISTMLESTELAS